MTILRTIHQTWNETHWEKSCLSEFGLSYQLGHGGKQCQYPGREELITVLEITGYHHVNIRFCACTQDTIEREDRNQLLQCRLFPASFKLPKTAFGFQLLDTMCLMTGRGRTSVYDVYLCLRSITDSCELYHYPVSHSSLG